MKLSLLTLSLVFGCFPAFAQDEPAKNACPPVENKKAIALYEKALDKKKYKKPERMEFLQKAIAMEPEYAEANFQLGMEMVTYSKLNNSSFAPAIPFFKKAVESCPQIHSEPYYYIGFDYYERMINDTAIIWLDKFIKFKDEDEKKFSERDYEGELANAKDMIKYAKKEAALKKKTVPFDPKVVQGISTKYSEYLPYISPDAQIFFFSRALPDDNINKVSWATDKEKEVFIQSKRGKDGFFDEGKPMPYPFNQTSNEGGATVTIDNKFLYYAQSRSEGGSQMNTDIYVTSCVGGQWSEIKKVPVINHPVYWDSQPTISKDGNTMIFVSDRPGGYGKLDLWITTRDPSNRMWTTPRNLGPKINTPENEKTPFLHSDFETLYYSSDGLFGFGGYDIFFTRKDEKGAWKNPENIGTPINMEGDDAGFFVSGDGTTGYFCSYNEGKVAGRGVGKYDVFQFDLYKEARPQAVVIIKGEIKKEDAKPLTNFSVEVKNLKTHEKTYAVVDSVTGHYAVAVLVDKNKNDNLVITANADNHAFTSQVIKMDSKVTFKDPPKTEVMEIKKAEKGKSFVINNIYYSTGAADLYPESYLILDEFAEFLINHPKMKVEIQGHTDNVGGAAENIKLSQQRADNTMAYLITKGVNKSMITAKGYGPNKPIADNSTVEGKAKNRRTEFMILEK
ncbi:MAG: outer membrane protein/peptidoglycan-associated protein [Bacteroidetes bacterium]|jgi:outer membrane protein OmpA-like peptidoglycan-associated protein/tetratricopeptide (TPR) repeat protein|nr:outer membrane protein/peptidoglycan-associated protein [Bacteroidota bacterium]